MTQPSKQVIICDAKWGFEGFIKTFFSLSLVGKSWKLC